MPTSIEDSDTYVQDAIARTRAAGDEGAEDNIWKKLGTEVGRSDPTTDEFWITDRFPKVVSMGLFRAILNTTEMAANVVSEPKTETTGLETAPRVSIREQYPGIFEAAHTFADEVETFNTTADDIVQGVAQFAIPFTAYLKAAGGVQAGATLMNIGKLAVAEGVTAATAFEPQEGRMADLVEMGRQSENRFGEVLNKVAPDGSLADIYINWMIDRENEGEWEGRFKNAVDSLVTTAGLATFLKGTVTALKTSRQALGELGAKTVRELQRGAVGTERTVEYAVNTSTGEHVTRIPGVGEVIAQEGETATGGTFINIKRADVVEPQRGTGAGVQMYERLVNEAHGKGIEVWSDVMVSSDAVRVYEALERRGYRLVRNPSHVNPNTGSLISDTPNVPVFQVLPKAVAAAGALAATTQVQADERLKNISLGPEVEAWAHALKLTEAERRAQIEFFRKRGDTERVRALEAMGPLHPETK